MKLFVLGSNGDFGRRLAALARIDVAPHEERVFEDGEFKLRPLVAVSGERVFVYRSLCGDARASAADNLLRLLVFVGAVKDAGAASVCCLLPYLAYARKDRRTKPWDPVTMRYVAQMLEAVGCDAVATLDVHNVAAFENAFRCATVHFEAAGPLARHFAAEARGAERCVVLAPDAGAVKRARGFAAELEAASGAPADLAFVEKSRSEGVISGSGFAGDVEGATVIVVDDIVSSGATLARAAEAALARGAVRVHAAVTHGAFSRGANDALGASAFESIAITDSIPDAAARCPALGPRLTVVETAGLFAALLKGGQSPFSTKKGSDPFLRYHSPRATQAAQSLPRGASSTRQAASSARTSARMPR